MRRSPLGFTTVFPMKLHRLFFFLLCLLLLGSGVRLAAGKPVGKAGRSMASTTHVRATHVRAVIKKQTVDKPTVHAALIALKEALLTPGPSFPNTLPVSVIHTLVVGFTVLLLSVRRIEIFYFFFSFFRRLFGHHIAINAP